MNKEVQNLLRVRNNAFKSGDTIAYKEARSRLKKGIKKAKVICRRRVENHFINADTLSMWQGIKSITDYKCNSVCPNDDVALANKLNIIFARFDTGNTSTGTTTTVAENEQALVLSTHEVQCALRRLNVLES